MVFHVGFALGILCTRRYFLHINTGKSVAGLLECLRKLNGISHFGLAVRSVVSACIRLRGVNGVFVLRSGLK